MLKELLNSKMFWILASIVGGYILGGIWKRISKSKQSGSALAIPFIAPFITVFILLYVKLNVTYFDIKFTLIGVAVMIIISFVIGYITYAANGKKVPFLNNVSFIYAGIAMVVFYVFYKDELKINTTQCAETKDIYLLLKKEDAGYFEINPDGIGYIGNQLFNDGFRPVFETAGIDYNYYSHVPVAVEIPTNSGTIHALKFESKTGNHNLDIEHLIETGIVKVEELKVGDLKAK